MKSKKSILSGLVFFIFSFITSVNLFSNENPQFYVRLTGFGISAHLWGYNYKNLYHRKIDENGIFIFNPGAGIDLGWFPKKNNLYVNFTFTGFNDCWSHGFYVATIGGGYHFNYKSFIASLGFAIGLFSQKTAYSIYFNGQDYFVSFNDRKVKFFAAINSNIGMKVTSDMSITLNISFTYSIMFFGISYTLFFF